MDDDIYFQTHLYPKILESAGQQKTAMSVVLLLWGAIYDCTGGVSLIEASMLVRMPELIDALILDKEVAEEAKNYFKRELAMAS